MITGKKQFTTIDEYIRTFPEDVQNILNKMRKTIQEAAPDQKRQSATRYLPFS